MVVNYLTSGHAEYMRSLPLILDREAEGKARSAVFCMNCSLTCFQSWKISPTRAKWGFDERHKNPILLKNHQCYLINLLPHCPSGLSICLWLKEMHMSSRAGLSYKSYVPRTHTHTHTHRNLSVGTVMYFPVPPKKKKKRCISSPCQQRATHCPQHLKNDIFNLRQVWKLSLSYGEKSLVLMLASALAVQYQG